MRKEYKRLYRVFNYFEHFSIFVSAASSCFSISALASLVCFYVGIAISIIGLTIWASTAGIKIFD